MLAPLLAALRSANHELGGVFSSINAQLYRQEIIHPYILSSSKTSIESCLHEIRDASYEYALIATEKIIGYELARKAKIPCRVGFWNGWSKPLKSLQLLRELHQRYLRPLHDADRHEVESLFRLGSGLHDEIAPTKDCRRLHHLLLPNVSQPRQAILIQMTKKWQAFGSPNRIAELLERLNDEYFQANGISLQLIGSSQERLFNENIAELSNIPLELFTEIEPWVRVISAAQVLITPDTGAAHIAGTVGTPVIDLFPSSTSEVQRVRWRPWATSSVVLSFEELIENGPEKLYQCYQQLL